MKKISKEIFTPYLPPKGTRHTKLVTPFPDGDYVCASEAHRVLLVRRDLLSHEYPEVPDHYNCVDYISEQEYDIRLTRDALKDALVDIPREEGKEMVEPAVYCDECGGEGMVEWTYDTNDGDTYRQEFFCPTCGGTGILKAATYRPTGRMSPQDGTYIQLLHIYVAAESMEALLDTMMQLDLPEVSIRSLQEGEPCHIHVADGIEFIFMPVKVTDEYCKEYAGHVIPMTL